MKTTTPIVLRLDPSTVEQIDEVRRILRMNRTEWLRSAVDRNLQFAVACELPAYRAAFGSAVTTTDQEAA